MKKLALAVLLCSMASTCFAEDMFDDDERDSRSLGPKIDYPAPPKTKRSARDYYFTGGRVNAMPFQSPAQSLEVVLGLAVQ